MFAAEPGRVTTTLVVSHNACGREHLHQVRRAEDVTAVDRRPHCGGPRYRVVFRFQAPLPYGVDYTDLGHWGDRDGAAYDEHGHLIKAGTVRIPAPRAAGDGDATAVTR